MRKNEQPPKTTPEPAPQDRLGGVRALAHDEDERPSREDRSYGETIFNRAVVPIPKFMRRRPRR